MKILKNMRSNLLALGVKLNRLAEQKLLEEMEFLEADLKRYWSKVQKGNETECWKWKGSTKSGYGQFKLFKRKLLPHRVAYILHNNEIIKDGMYVCHSCDNKKCVNPNHLWIGTNRDNQIDAVKKGLIPSRNGELSATSKLKNYDVIVIRRLCSMGMAQYKIAKIFNVLPPQISRIKNGTRWNHI